MVCEEAFVQETGDLRVDMGERARTEQDQPEMHSLPQACLDHAGRTLQCATSACDTCDDNSGSASAMMLHSPTLKASSSNKHVKHQAGPRLMATCGSPAKSGTNFKRVSFLWSRPPTALQHFNVLGIQRTKSFWVSSRGH